jgi:hypothetical protein
VRLSVFEAADQFEALNALAELANRSSIHPTIRAAALTLTNNCPARADECELSAIFNAVKSGDSRIKGLEKGLRYVSDPRWADYFSAPQRTLQLCRRGACGADCDDHASLICSLGAALGHNMGLRVWGKEKGVFSHVYAVARVPKRAPRRTIGMDSTVPYSFLGWEPEYGYSHTQWLE